MTISELMRYCLSKNGAYEDHPFGSEPTVIKVKVIRKLPKDVQRELLR